jgi:hypothetical protein
MKFTLFSETEFEIAYPIALIESYCFQSDFYANYDRLIDKKVEAVNAIGARILKDTLPKCETVILNNKNVNIFKYDVDKFLSLDDKTMTNFVEELVTEIINPLMKIDGVGLSKVTKLLHTVYPGIIPIIDSMLQKAYIQTKSGKNWKASNPSEIFIAYYKNLKEPPTINSLSEIYIEVSPNLQLTKIRVFDIIWWSYLKANKLREEGVNWVTI